MSALECFIALGYLLFWDISSFPLKSDVSTLIASMLCLVLGSILFRKLFHFPSFFFSVFKPYNFYTVDYFPLFPWWGVVLLGIFLGKQLYPGYKRIFPLPDWSRVPLIQAVSFLGQHSLTIYILHQPIIIIILFLLGLIHLPI